MLDFASISADPNAWHQAVGPTEPPETLVCIARVLASEQFGDLSRQIKMILTTCPPPSNADQLGQTDKSI